ncbi:uncharacterized protein LOC111079292 [Drosophila obscura]|uniref:uncharacterized protein LOC111079292 n=1 Tax=Drosophila obscura TaxID=7282 RepID=UPI001BB239E4|nr:uncharacterized protein LOC111079292 [Drosophila obscura]
MDSPPGHLSVYMFVIHTAILMSYFVLCSILQWMLLCIYMKHSHIVYTMICFFAALVLLTFIHFSQFLKYGKPWNYVAILFCYELLTLGVTSFIVDSSVGAAIGVVVGALFLWIIVLAGCYAIIRFVSYPNPYTLAGIGIVGLMMSMVMVAVEQVIECRACGEIALVAVMVTVILMMISHVLLTHDSRDLLKKDDTLLVAFVLYIHYVILMVTIFIFVIRDRRYSKENEPTPTVSAPSYKRPTESTMDPIERYKYIFTDY